MTEERARQAELYLVGMVCYYGKHYSTFFFQTKIRKWMYFDDAHVKEVRAFLSGAGALQQEGDALLQQLQLQLFLPEQR